MIIVDLKNGKVRVRPDNGLTLYDVRNEKEYSEVVVKKNDVKWFKER